MGIMIECPDCRRRGGLKRKVCKCGCSVQKAHSKNYWIEFYEEGKRVRERIGRSKQAAENRLREVQTAKAEGRHIRKNKNTTQTIGQLYEWYLTLPEVKSLKTYSKLKHHWPNILRIIGSKKKISELSFDSIKNFINVRGSEPSRWKKKELIAPATIRKEIALLKSLLNVSVRYGKIESNPVKEAAMPKVENTRMSTISFEDFQRLLECSDLHIRPILIMAYFEPMRRDEITKLTWDEVDLKNRFIRLAATRTKGGKMGRSIPMHPEVLKMLFSLPRSLQTKRVFLRNIGGELLPFDEFKHSWETARKKAGIGDFVFHDFRHVAISNLRKAGNSPSVIMKASGHSTMSMFLRYNLVDEDDLKGMQWLGEVSSKIKDQVEKN